MLHVYLNIERETSVIFEGLVFHVIFIFWRDRGREVKVGGGAETVPQNFVDK